MISRPLYFVWDYREVDARFWNERLEDWVPERIVDAHMHIMDPALRLEPMTEAMRRQYWVNEVFEPQDATSAARCYEVVFPRRSVQCVAFGFPDLAFDLERGNRYVSVECQRLGWLSLALLRPEWSQEKTLAALDAPGVIGAKPYYSLIGASPDSRDAHLEASILDFLPPHQLEILDARQAWVTLHVPKAARLGHRDNLREVKELRERYPRISFVIAHLGRCYTEAHAREALPHFRDDEGLYFDTSAVLNPASHRVALEILGPQRILYGTDNPVMFMRGRRQYGERGYINRTSHPFHFNREREPAEIEARYTLYMYEDLHALRQASQDLGISDKASREAIFHDNARRLMDRALAGRGLVPGN